MLSGLKDLASAGIPYLWWRVLPRQYVLLFPSPVCSRPEAASVAPRTAATALLRHAERAGAVRSSALARSARIASRGRPLRVAVALIGWPSSSRRHFANSLERLPEAVIRALF